MGIHLLNTLKTWSMRLAWNMHDDIDLLDTRNHTASCVRYIPRTRSANNPPRRPDIWLSPMMIFTEAVPRPTSMLPRQT